MEIEENHNIIIEKTCSKCKLIKTIDSFTKDKTKKEQEINYDKLIKLRMKKPKKKCQISSTNKIFYSLKNIESMWYSGVLQACVFTLVREGKQR